MEQTVNTGNTLYDLNKQMVEKEPALLPMTIAKKQEILKEFFQNHFGYNTYFMLLCHERRDYTVLRVIESPAKAAQEVIGCILDRGEMIACEITDGDNEAFEIWARIDDEAFCYYLFAYDPAVIEV